MALTISTYVDPGVYIQEVIVPGALNLATVPSTPTIIAHGSRSKRANNEAVTRGLVEDESLTMVDVTGTGDSITAPAAFGGVADTQTLTDTAATFPTTVVGKSITISGGPAGNNGTFTVVARPSATTITYVNGAGVIDGSFTGTYTITPHATLANRGNRRVTNTTIEADGVAHSDSAISYAPAVLTSSVSGTYALVASTNDAISLELDGNTPVTIIFTAGAGATTVSGTEITVGESTIATLATAGATEVAAAINEALNPTDSGANTSVTALGYGAAYGAVAVATDNTTTGEVQITSPVTNATSDVRMFAPITRSAMTDFFGSEADQDATVDVNVNRASFDDTATYTADYIDTEDFVDSVSNGPATSFVRVGAFSGVGTFTENTDYVDASGTLDWSNLDASGVITNATTNGIVGTGSSPPNYDITDTTQDTLRIALDGRAAVDVDLIGATNGGIGYTSVTSGDATAAEVAAAINAVVSVDANYGARYNSIADTTSVGGNTVIRITSPNDTNSSSVALSNPTTASAMSEVFGLSATQTSTSLGNGTRPASASVYFVTYEYDRPSADYNNPQQFFNIDQGLAFTGPLAADNPLSIGIDLAFKNGAPTCIVIQVDDATSEGSPTRLEYQDALAAAETKSTATDICLLSTDLATQVDILQHVENQSSPTEQNFRRAWYGMARGTSIGDRDTPDTFVFRATQTLQVAADSPGRGRHILVAPPGVEGISKTIALENGTTVKLDLDSTYLALACAARMASFTSPAEALARKTITGFDITEGDFTPWVRGERAAMAQDGVTVVTFDAGRFILLDPTTTERGGGGLISFEQISGSTQKDNINRKVQQALDANIIGIVPSDLADFIIDIKLFIANVLAGEIGAGAIGPFRDSNGNTRPIDLNRDIVVEQDPNDPTQFFFKFFFNLRYPALRLFGEFSVDNPFFTPVP